MKLDRSRLQEIAGLEPDNMSETRAITYNELEHDARELLAKIGMKNPTNDQMKTVIQVLADLIKQSGSGTMLTPSLQFELTQK
jgi:hypothetical protein